MCGPRRHRNDQDRLQFSIYLKGRMKLPESVLVAGTARAAQTSEREKGRTDGEVQEAEEAQAGRDP